MIDLYLKKAFSTRACWWYPGSFLHWRRPTFFTLPTVRFCGVVDRDRVVGGVGCEARDVILNRAEEIESSIRIVRVSVGVLGEGLGEPEA